MRLQEILELVYDKLDKLNNNYCEGCRLGLGNQLAHSCLTVNRWIYFEEGIKELLQEDFISPEEHTLLLILNDNEFMGD